MSQQASQRVSETIRIQSFKQRLSQSQIAEVLGISQAGVSRRLLGKTAFSLDELAQIAPLLHMSMADLVADEAVAS